MKWGRKGQKKSKATDKRYVICIQRQSIIFKKQKNVFIMQAHKNM